MTLEFIPMNKFLTQVQYIHIGTSAYFDNLKTTKGLEQLESIGMSAYFPVLQSAKGLEQLKSIGGYADFTTLSTTEKQKIKALQYLL